MSKEFVPDKLTKDQLLQIIKDFVSDKLTEDQLTEDELLKIIVDFVSDKLTGDQWIEIIGDYVEDYTSSDNKLAKAMAELGVTDRSKLTQDQWCEIRASDAFQPTVEEFFDKWSRVAARASDDIGYLHELQGDADLLIMKGCEPYKMVLLRRIADLHLEKADCSAGYAAEIGEDIKKLRDVRQT